MQRIHYIFKTSGNSNHSRIEIGTSQGSDNGGIHLYTAGASVAERRITIKGTSGNIGIGTVNVIAKVDIISGTGDGTQNEANCLRLRNRANNGNAMTLQVGVNTAAAGGFNQGYAYLQGQFWGGGSNPIFLNPKGGNIGIGRTGAYVPLDINGDTILRAAGTTTQGDLTRRYGFTGPSNTSNPTSYIAGVADKTNWYQGLGLVFATVSGNDIGNTLGVERMRITSDGNVGIGEDNPSAKLEVRSAGATAVFNSGAANDGRLEFEYNSSRVGLLAYHSDRLEIQTDSSKDFTIRTNGANERLRITSGGKVGLGEPSPDFKFHSKETGGSSIAGLFETNQTDAYISFQASGTTASSTVRIGAVGDDFQAFINGGERLRITSGGNITYGNQSTSTANNSSALVHISAGKESWSGTAGDYRALKHRIYDNNLDDVYGMGVSAGLLEIQAQKLI